MLIVNEAELARFSKKIVKVWGVEYVLLNNELYCQKLLKVMPGYRSSVHKHLQKDETFIGIQGCTVLTVDLNDSISHRDLVIIAITPGRQYRIKPGTWHCFETHTESWVMEVSTAHSEDDVVRSIPSRKIEDEKAS